MGSDGTSFTHTTAPTKCMECVHEYTCTSCCTCIYIYMYMSHVASVPGLVRILIVGGGQKSMFSAPCTIKNAHNGGGLEPRLSV